MRGTPGNVIDIWTGRPFYTREPQTFADYDTLPEITVEAPADISSGIDWGDVTPLSFDESGSLLEDTSSGIDWGSVNPLTTALNIGGPHYSPVASAPTAGGSGGILQSLGTGIATGASVAAQVIAQTSRGTPVTASQNSAQLAQQLMAQGASNTAAIQAALANLQAHGYTSGAAQSVLQSQLDSQGLFSLLTPTQWLLIGGAVLALVFITRR